MFREQAPNRIGPFGAFDALHPSLREREHDIGDSGEFVQPHRSVAGLLENRGVDDAGRKVHDRRPGPPILVGQRSVVHEPGPGATTQLERAARCLEHEWVAFEHVDVAAGQPGELARRCHQCGQHQSVEVGQADAEGRGEVGRGRGGEQQRHALAPPRCRR